MATVKKVKKAQNGESITKKGSNYVYTTKSNRPEGSRYYQGESPDYSTARKIAKFNSQYRPSDSTRKASLSADQLKDLDKQKNGGKTPAWQRKEGKSPSGGLNAKGRASLKAAGHDIKAPQPEGGPRKKSFCARMTGMKKKLTSAKTAKDPNSRINKSLRKWKC